MKKLIVLSIVFLSVNVLGQTSPQLLVDENFQYTPGVLSYVSNGSWINTGSGLFPVKVREGSLTYPSYSNNPVGNYILLDDSSATRYGIKKNLMPLINSGSLYVSFLMKLRDTLDLASAANSPAVLFAFTISYPDSIDRSVLYIRKSNVAGNAVLGLVKSSVTNIKYDTARIPVQQNTLIVLKYKFSSGTDTLSLWINPPLTGTEPSPDVISYAETNDMQNIAAAGFRQSANGGNIFIDAFRISSSWENMPLPVQLSSFTCERQDFGILLRWKTETEIDNFGFELQRKFNDTPWEKIAFINGAGNCNSPRFYSFRDDDFFTPGIYFYRLKQIDNSGSYVYSDLVEADTRTMGEFEILQNFPNPFNPSTTIRFKIPAEGFTRITLYNMLGEKIEVIAEGIMQPGFQSVQYNAGGICSGVYFCVLEHGGKFRTIKVTVTK